MAKQGTKSKRKPGRPASKEGPRSETVKVSLHPDELETIMKATDAPAAFLREHGLKAAAKLTPKPKRP